MFKTKLIVFIVSICFLLIWFTYWSVSVSFNWKLESADDTTYRTDMWNITLWDKYKFKFVAVVLWTDSNSATLSFPWFLKYDWWFSTDWSSCPISSSNYSNWTTTLTFSWISPVVPCIVEVFMDYKPDSLWSKSLTAVVNSSVEWTISATVTSDVTVTSVTTQDNNWNWYLDSVEIDFSDEFDLSLFDENYTSVKLGSVEATNYSLSWNSSNWSNLELFFDDWTRNTSKLPNFNLTWYTNWWIIFSTIWNTDILEVDWAKPVLISINWSDIIDSEWNSITWTVQINSNSNINFVFSEDIDESTICNILLKYWWVTAITWAWNKISWNNYEFNPDENLTWDIEIEVWTWVQDLSANWWNSIEYNVVEINVVDNEAPVWTNLWAWTWVVINSWQSSTNNRYVNLSLWATDDFWVSKMMISNYSNFSWASWQTYATSKTNWWLLEWTWIKTVYVKYRDWASNDSDVYSDTIQLNYTANYVNISTSIPSYVTTSTLNLQWWCSYNTAATNLYLEYSINSWPYQWNVICNNTSKEWSFVLSWYTLNSSNTLDIRFKHDNSVSVDTTFTHDNTGPTWTMTIKNWDTYTTSRSVNLQLSASDVNWVKRVFITWDVISSFRWYFNYTSPRLIQLTSWNWTKTVQVKYEDNAWNLTSSFITDTIIFDNTAPTWSVSINWWDSYTNSVDVTLTISATDTNWVTQMKISKLSDLSDASYVAYQTSGSYSFDSWDWSKTVYIKFKDNAWNESITYSDTITLDTTNPTTSISPSSGTYDNNNPVTLTINCSDWNSWCGDTYYRIWWWSYNSYTWTFDVSWSNESITVDAYSEDNAWNTSFTVSNTYTFDESYLNIISDVPDYYSWDSLLLTWNCENFSWSNDLEYTINDWVFTWFSCSGSNTWSKSINLLQNQTNEILVRFQDNHSLSVSWIVIHDNIPPSNLSMEINNWDAYTTSQDVNLSLTWTDDNTVYIMYLTWDIEAIWYTWYVESKNVELLTWDWTKTIYLKLVDIVWNESDIISWTIILDTTDPTVTASPEWWNFTSPVSLSLTLSESWKIYFSYNSDDDLISEWQVYWSSLTINSEKTIYYIWVDNAWNQSGKYSQIYTFNCSSWEEWNWTECETVEETSSSSGWGWWWGGGWWSYWWYSVCMTSQLRCVNWKYEKIKWVSCIWWKLWRTCSNLWWETVDSWSDSSKDSSVDDNLDEIEQKIVENNASQDDLSDYSVQDSKEKVKSQVSNEYDWVIEKIYSLFVKESQLWIKTSVISPKIKKAFSKYSYSLEQFMINILKFKETLDKSFKTKAKENLNDFVKYWAELKEIFYWYIDKDYLVIYKPADSNFRIVFDKIESRLIWKIQKLRNSNQISVDEYKQFVSAYNDFVLSVLVYKFEWYKKSLTVAKLKLDYILSVYNIKLIIPSEEIVVNEKYSRTINVWDSWDDVRMLQFHLVEKWYYDPNISKDWYFSDKVLQLSKKYLKIEYWINIGELVSKDILNKYFTTLNDNHLFKADKIQNSSSQYYRALNIWIEWNDVEKLQRLLYSEWYWWDYWITWYFWNLTFWNAKKYVLDKYWETISLPITVEQLRKYFVR